MPHFNGRLTYTANFNLRHFESEENEPDVVVDNIAVEFEAIVRKWVELKMRYPDANISVVASGGLASGHPEAPTYVPPTPDSLVFSSSDVSHEVEAERRPFRVPVHLSYSGDYSFHLEVDAIDEEEATDLAQEKMENEDYDYLVNAEDVLSSLYSEGYVDGPPEEV